MKLEANDDCKNKKSKTMPPVGSQSTRTSMASGAVVLQKGIALHLKLCTLIIDELTQSSNSCSSPLSRAKSRRSNCYVRGSNNSRASFEEIPVKTRALYRQVHYLGGQFEWTRCSAIKIGFESEGVLWGAALVARFVPSTMGWRQKNTCHVTESRWDRRVFSRGN